MLKYFIFISLLSLSFFTSAQSDISVGSIAKRMVEVLDENHIQPRTLDESLARSIHDNILNSLDDDMIFFTKENITELEEQLPNLVRDIPNELEMYLNTLKGQFNDNLESIRGFHKSYFASDLNLEKGITNKVSEEEHISNSQFQMRWNLIFRNTIVTQVLDKIEDQEYKSIDDSLSSFIAASKSRVEEIYSEYLDNLGDDISFVDNIYLNAIAMSYDPHSNYFSASQNEQFEQELSSERELFGVSYSKNLKGELEVLQIVPGSSAWLSGQVRVGDVINAIKFGDDETVDLKGKTRFQLGKLFDESNSDKIVLTLYNENDGVKTVELLKTKVYSDDDIIKAALLKGDKNVGYISLPDFYTNWNDDGGHGCANDLAKTLIKLKRENIDGVILDLRDNGGGSLKEAIDLTGIFIDFGPVLVASGEEKPITFKDFNRGAIYNGPLIVMVNENSASASEVVAGALQDYNRAVIVGQPSFGKATGQSVYPVAPNSIAGGSNAGAWGFVKITEMGLYRIDLQTNQFNGVTPDINLELPYEYDPFREKDYPNVIHLDSIEKKMYYTALPENDLAGIASKSKERQENAEYFVSIKSFSDQIDAVYEGVEFSYLTLSESIEISKKISELKDEISSVYDEISNQFASESLQYDDGVYEMSEYMNMYKEAFHEEIESDGELAETYTILLELINK